MTRSRCGRHRSSKRRGVTPVRRQLEKREIFSNTWHNVCPPAREAAAPRRGIVTDVAAHGVRNPILLYDEDDTYFILDGIHRFHASRRAGKPCPYTMFEGDRLAALAASNSLNDRRRHLDTSERLAVAAREQLAAQSNGAPRPTTAEVAASMGVSERHYQRAKARERERQGLPQPLGGQPPQTMNVSSPPDRQDLRAFMRDKPEKTSLDDVARLVRRLKDVPPPGEQRADPDTFSAAFLTNIIHALEINLYGALVNREPVPDYLRSTTEKAHATATTIAETLPARVKRPRQQERCQADQCRGDGRIPQPMRDQLRIFCDRCVY